MDSTPKPLNKTLTLGLGRPFGFDKRKTELIPLADEDLKKVYNAIRKASTTYAKLCNRITAHIYAQRILGIQKDDPDAERFTANYAPLMQEMKLEDCLSGSVKSQSYGEAKSHFSGEHGRKLLFEGSRQLSIHKTDGTHPIPIRAAEAVLFEQEERFYLAGQLFSQEWAKANGLHTWLAFPLHIKPRDKTMRTQLLRVIEKEWDLCNARILRNSRNKNPQWLGQIVVKYQPDPYKMLSPDTTMGIDLGVMSPAAIHIRTNGEPLKWAMLVGDGRAMLRARSLIRREIIRLLRALRTRERYLDGAARDKAREQLRELRKQEQRVMKTVTRRLAASIGDLARRHGAGIWQMEDLSPDIKEDKPWLARNWAPGALKDALRWQADQFGAEVKFVNPRKTSQRCSQCGHIDPLNRPKKKEKAEVFLCVKCGYKDHADKNAARNLSIMAIDELITQALLD